MEGGGEGEKEEGECRRALSHCLFRESRELVFSQNKKNVLVKFNLIFGL